MSEQVVPERAEVQDVDIERHMQRVKARELKRQNRALRRRTAQELAALVRQVND